MQENSQARSHVHAATLGQFLMVLMKSVDLDCGTVLGSSFHETEEDHCVSYQITYGKEMSKKGESTWTELKFSHWIF